MAANAVVESMDFFIILDYTIKECLTREYQDDFFSTAFYQ